MSITLISSREPTVNPADVPVVILAGGRGARFDHESRVTPKPMIEVAGKPILQHVIDSFQRLGFREFIIPVGYLGEVISGYFGDRLSRHVAAGRHDSYTGGGVTVTVADTGEEAHTGLRLWRVRELIDGRRFVLTYGDGLADVDMTAVLKQHQETGAMVTMTVVHPPGRFGVAKFAYDDSESTEVVFFGEKPREGWINGGFMVMEPEFIDQYVEGESELESMALPELAEAGGLHAFKHTGYWRCMDTRRDRELIEEDVRRGGRLPWMDEVG